MTEPAGNAGTDPLSSLTFSDVPPLPDDAPDFRASADVPPTSGPPTPESAGPSMPRKRRLPGRDGPIFAGSRDQSTRRDREKTVKPPRSERPLPPIPAKGFAPGVEKMYEALAMAVLPFDVELAETLRKVAPEAAQAWDELARQNHMVRRLLVAMMETTAWGQVIAAHSPLVGLAFARMMGTSTRQTLAQMMMGAQAEAFMRSQENGNGDAAA